MSTTQSSLEGDVAVVTVGTTSYRLAVPHHETDYIQGRVASSGEPYEKQMLQAMVERLEPGSLVLDVGANVGNHTMYLALVGGLDIVAYEPNKELADAIERSVALNGVDKLVTIRSVAVGAEPGRGVLSELDSTNLGGQSVLRSIAGDFEIISLDQEVYKQPVAAMKIDVEGMELEVLQGAAELIARDKPILFVECRDAESFMTIGQWLVERDYGYLATYNATPTHLFRPVGDSGDVELRTATLRAVVQHYEAAEQVRELRQATNAARMKYREAMERIDSLKAAAERHGTEASISAREAQVLEDRRAEAEEARVAEAARRADAEEGVRRELANITNAYERVRGEALQYKKVRDVHAARVSTLYERAVQTKKQLDAAQAAANRLRNGRAHRMVRAVRGARSARRMALLPRDLWRIYRDRPRAGTRQRSGVSQPAVQTAGVAAPKYLEPTRLGDARIHDATTLASRAEIARRSSDRLREMTRTDARVRVAAIVDDFTRRSLALECDLLNLHPDRWEEELSGFQPHVLFVESAWRGESGAWHNTVPRLVKELQDILAWCRQHEVPTVFWNKEDPVHFRTFLRTAAEFDHVFTTDLDRVGDYRTILGHERAHYLGFACQPKIQNPIEHRDRKDAMVFAGGYYVRYKERMRDLGRIMDGVRDVMPLEIYDRMLGTTLEEYAFPEEYSPYIVGTLSPDEIEIAYKGYRYALNLNSVKSSQSMFARRAYELLSSGTMTISNYARGLHNIFGDLVPMTDSRRGAETIVTELRNDVDRTDKLRLMGLRKVHSEHTYADRLRRVLAQAADVPFTPRTFAVTALIPVADQAQAHWGLETVRRQRDVTVHPVFVTDDVAAAADLHSSGAQVLGLKEAAHKRVKELAEGTSGVAVLDPRDWYGDFYLIDLVLATQYSDAGAIGKAGRFVSQGDRVVRVAAGSEYRAATGLVPRRALVSAVVAGELAVSTLLASDDPEGLADVSQLAIDRFDYCESGAELEAEAIRPLRGELPVSTGWRTQVLYEDMGQVRHDPRGSDDARMVPLEWLTTSAGARDASGVEAVVVGQGLRITSDLDKDTHRYLWTRGRLDATALWPDGEARIYLDADARMDIQVALRFYGDAGTIVGSTVQIARVAHRLPLPDGTRSVAVGVRLKGSGMDWVWGITLDDVDVSPLLIPSAKDALVVADNYPAYENLYRNGFIHRRLMAYAEMGLTADVLRLSTREPMSYREFEGVEVATGGGDLLRGALVGGQHSSILVHFLNPDMWSTVRDFQDSHRVIIWVHGAEVQPWWRRKFNFTTTEELERAKVASDARLAFWRQVMSELRGETTLVFVSQYFAEEVMEDLDVAIPESRIRVIHNPIDTDLFEYSPKNPEMRKRVLSIRTYATPKYANDLAVAAVLELSKRPWFGDLDFRFIGDGALFDETLAPLRDFSNVTIERGFLRQQDIATIQQDYGLFLVPTRWDSQGVSRDEAMSSGLVPVTNAVSAIPEFVDESCAYLADGEDHLGLAAGIERAYLDPEGFLRKSAAAAARVRRQTASDIVIPQEIELIRGAVIR